MNTLSERDVSIVIATLERGEQEWITATFGDVSDKNLTFHDLNRNVNDKTRSYINDKASEFPVHRTRFERLPYIHYMVTRQTTQTNQILQLFTGRMLRQLEPPAYKSYQIQSLSTP